MLRAFAIAVILPLIFLTCGNSPGKKPMLKYIPLGDSYTICHGLDENASWPFRLAAHLTDSGVPVQLVKNPSKTGWTTVQLLEKELPVFEQEKADITSILIGVNDWVQNIPETVFKSNLDKIIGRVCRQIKDKRRIILVTIPDFGVTPSGKLYGGGRTISEGILAFNKIIIEKGKEEGIAVVDIFEVSKQMGKDPGLVHTDGLHPSEKEYGIWEKMIFTAWFPLLKKSM